jgi:hypothetical protein
MAHRTFLRISTVLIFLSLSGSIFAQEKKMLDNIGNENTNQASFSFAQEDYNFGTITQGESITYEFKFTNNGSEPLIISKSEGSCGCTVPVWPKEPVMKGQSSAIKVTFNSTGKFGMQDKTVTITSNAKQNPMVLHLKGNVEKPKEVTPVEKPSQK